MSDDKDKRDKDRDKEKRVSLKRLGTNIKPKSPNRTTSMRMSVAVNLDALHDIPSPDVVDKQFEDLREDLGIPKEAAALIDTKQKWLLILQNNSDQAVTAREGDNELKEIVKTLSKGRKSAKTKFLIMLRTLLTSKPRSWVKDFIKQGGLDHLIEIFRDIVSHIKKSIEDKEAESVTECFKSLKAVMNIGADTFDYVINIEDYVALLVKSTIYLSPLPRAEIYEFLAVVCIRKTSKRVFREFNQIGFKHIVESLKTKNHYLRVATLVLVNGLVCGADDTSTHAQISLALEQAKFEEALDPLRNSFLDDTQWVTQIKILSEFEAEYKNNIDNQLAKLNSKCKLLEREIEELRSKNAILAEEKEAAVNSTGGGRGMDRLLRDKDEIIVRLEAQIRALGHVPISPILDGPPLDLPPAPVGNPDAPDINSPLVPPPPVSGSPADLPPPPPDGGAPPPPPPPPGAAPPPPPPPPGAPGAPPPNLPTKKVIKPSRKMRGLMWQKLNAGNIKNTIWEKIDDEKVKLNAKELEEIFGIDPDAEKKREEALAAKMAKAEEKQKTISLLDNKRGNNVEIMLKGLKMNNVEVKNALLKMDEEALSPEELNAIKNNIPTIEEIKLLETYDGDIAELGKAERFFLAIGAIPLLEVRINALSFKKSFSTTSQEVEESLNTFAKSVKILRSEAKFHKIIELILAIGNYLNGNTPRGGSFGFKVGNLRKLIDVRSPQDGQITLMHYLSDKLEKQYPDLGSCLKEFAPIHAAAKENLQETLNDVSKLNTGLAPIATQLSSATCDPVFKSCLGPFVPIATKKMESIFKTAEKLQNDYKDLLAFYGEPATTKSEEFFSVMADFAAGLEKAAVETKKRIEDEEKAKKQAAAKAAADAARAAAKASRGESSDVEQSPGGGGTPGLRVVSPRSDGNDAGDIDQMISDLKSGGIFLRKLKKTPSSQSNSSIQQPPGSPTGLSEIKLRSTMTNSHGSTAKDSPEPPSSPFGEVKLRASARVDVSKPLPTPPTLSVPSQMVKLRSTSAAPPATGKQQKEEPAKEIVKLRSTKTDREKSDG